MTWYPQIRFVAAGLVCLGDIDIPFLGHPHWQGYRSSTFSRDNIYICYRSFL